MPQHVGLYRDPPLALSAGIRSLRSRYCIEVAIMLVSFLTRLTFHTVSVATGSNVRKVQDRVESATRLNSQHVRFKGVTHHGHAPVHKVECDPGLTRSLLLLGSDVESLHLFCCFTETLGAEHASKTATQRQNRGAGSEWVETWRLSMSYAIGVATQYSTASEATGCRHSTTVSRVLAIIECRHPVASLTGLSF